MAFSFAYLVQTQQADIAMTGFNVVDSFYKRSKTTVAKKLLDQETNTSIYERTALVLDDHMGQFSRFAIGRGFKAKNITVVNIKHIVGLPDEVNFVCGILERYLRKSEVNFDLIYADICGTLKSSQALPLCAIDRLKPDGILCLGCFFSNRGSFHQLNTYQLLTDIILPKNGPGRLMAWDTERQYYVADCMEYFLVKK